jgi:hypothetical protein
VEVSVSKVLRRPKGTAKRVREEDPDIIAVLDQMSVLTPSERDVRALLRQLIEQEQLELCEGVDLDQLSIRLAEALGETRTPKGRARIASAWLLEQDEVEDLYLDDDELARAIASR